MMVKVGSHNDMWTKGHLMDRALELGKEKGGKTTRFLRNHRWDEHILEIILRYKTRSIQTKITRNHLELILGFRTHFINWTIFLNPFDPSLQKQQIHSMHLSYANYN